MAFKTEYTLTLEDHTVIVACVWIVAPQAQALGERRVDGIVFDLFHKITVTLFAEFCPRRLEQFCLIRSVGIVTGGTLPHLYGIVDGIFLKSSLRIGMAGVAHFIRSVFQQAGEIRSVGIMAASAHFLGEGRMLMLEFQCVLCFFMAGKAEVCLFRNQQMFILGGMGHMARETTPPACDRRMGKSNTLPFVRMAAETELVSTLHQEFRVFGAMGIMTLDAHAALEGRVLFVPPRFEIVQRMALLTKTADIFLLQRERLYPIRGIMAHIAAPRHDRIVRAFFHKFRLVR